MSLMKLLALSFAFVLLMPSVYARLGDTRSDFKYRLTGKHLADEYPDDMLVEKLKDRENPYREQLSFFPEDAEHVIFHKKTGDERVHNDDVNWIEVKNRQPRIPFKDGWDLHVVFWRGQSVFESYRRNGPHPNQFEIEGLLMLNKGDSHWKPIKPNEQKDSVFGYSYETQDGKRRALHKGRTIVIYYTEMDKGLLKVRDKQNAETAEEQKGTVEESLIGF